MYKNIFSPLITSGIEIEHLFCRFRELKLIAPVVDGGGLVCQ